MSGHPSQITASVNGDQSSDERFIEKRILWKQEDGSYQFDGITWGETEIERLEMYLKQFETPCELCSMLGREDHEECVICHGTNVEKIRDYRLQTRTVRVVVSSWRDAKE